MAADEAHGGFASFLGLRFNLLDQTRTIAVVRDLAEGAPFTYVATPNVDHMVRLHREHDNPRLWAAYENATLLLCDSRILKRLAKLSGLDLDLVTGSDLTAKLLDHSSQLQSAAVIGGDEVLMRDLRAQYPAVTWYWHEPPHGVLRNPAAQQAIVEFVEGCPAGLFFFAIGSPQSEVVCQLVAERGKARGVGLCIGASLEFLTGAKTRAPRWMQRTGLEWLFRLASEPARLWRRYLIEGPQIFLIWWRWRLSSSR